MRSDAQSSGSTRAATARLGLLALTAILLAAAPARTARTAEAPGDAVLVLSVDGPITPAVADYLERGIAAGSGRGAALIVLELDTPGGLDASTRLITQAILGAPAPVVVFVSPAGARAASAGTFITLAADVAAMAPGTTIGAAHPVSLVGASDETMAAKVANDAAAYLRGLAERRGRNGDWAEKAVLESASLTAAAALDQGVIDLVAPDLPALLAALEGRGIERAGRPAVLRTAGLPVERLPMDWRRRLLDLLANPNVAYLLLMAGLIGIFFELSHPGVIFPGVLGGVALILALYSLQTLPVSAAGVLLILLAVALFVAELQVASSGILGTGAVVALALGSVMLVRSPLPWLRISLSVIVPMVGLMSLFVLVVLRLVVRAQLRRPATGAEGMLGERGEALEDLAPRGKVFVRGETWEAESAEHARKGDRVEVVAVRGLRLEVRPHPEGRS